MQETRVWFLGWEDPLERGTAAHSSVLAWRIPWTEEPSGLQSIRSKRVGHNLATKEYRHRHRYISFQTCKYIYIIFPQLSSYSFYNDIWNWYNTKINRATGFQWGVAKHVSHKIMLANSMRATQRNRMALHILPDLLFPNNL